LRTLFTENWRRILKFSRKQLKAVNRCPHDIDQWSPAWVDAQGALNPTFSALIFVGAPTESRERDHTLFLVNENDFFSYTTALSHRSEPGDKIFTSPAALRAVAKVQSLSGVHKLRIHSTGASSALCSNRSHEVKKWIDNFLPLYVESCQLKIRKIEGTEETLGSRKNKK